MGFGLLAQPLERLEASPLSFWVVGHVLIYGGGLQLGAAPYGGAKVSRQVQRCAQDYLTLCDWTDPLFLMFYESICECLGVAEAGEFGTDEHMAHIWSSDTDA